MISKTTRFDVLDALRGLCAILVVFFHLPVSSHFHALPLTRHGYLFVDFFFVLSGFVIAHAYRERIATVGDAGRFLVRRVGRVWPLHMAILAAFVLLELCRLWFRFDAVPPFTGDRAPQYLISNILLIQAFGIHSHLTWNGPAWSISVEMGCYVLFALMLLAAPRRFAPIAVVLAVAGALVVLAFAPRYMNTTYNFGFPRAMYGFLLGCLVQRIWSARPDPSPGLVRWLEPISLIAAVAYVSLARGPWTVLAPLIFAVCIWVFASEAGRVSRWLSARPLLRLGHWSYSIYMTHMLVITLMLIVARRAGIMENRRIDFGSVWLNDLFALAVLAVIIGLSALTYRWIETPGRDWINGWLKRREARRTRPVLAAETA
ncbi:acyltransferase [Brevundimonas sp.]|uniref:acyltransferase family protein n=1 Tax=Brevundimonas sp. TaxID=1871086 RepID=UPI0019B11A7B|nr:acyltransferase [Brevundimonas sp.]MBD3836915.1 acyltransferase [Brevundimonas sp.]